jgi:serine/threonine-protein kinase
MADRLQQERDALAALEHPNIARLYDAGTTDTGRPYIAMEHVDGVPIDRYAATHSLTLRERLSLFLQVAGAVSYAHARLIVHRDLKPSNILVSESQGVRLLDFGAAKLLREDVPGDSELTRELGPALSPEYASPEQIRGERVTVATDVYSLGVVLYELLTGERPYRLTRESWAALVEAVSRVNVPLASSRVRGDPKLARLLRGDLDAVLAKALSREVGERYPSVQAFADDVSRYLSGEPVQAKEQGVRERLWKFVRRHSIAVGTAAAVTLLVGAASGVAFWQARVARVQAARAERVRQFIASILTSAVPKTGVGGVVTASDLLSAAARRIETELSGEPAVAAELGVIVGDSFDNLGEPEKAEPVYRAAAARAEATLGRTHPLTLEAKTDLATELAQHDVPGALVLIEEVIPEARKGLPATAALAVEALKDQSFALAKLNRPEPSYGALRESIQLAEKYFGPLDERTISGVELLANTYGRFGDRANELATATDAVDRARRAFGAQRPHNTLLATERTYADALRNSDRPADSAIILRGVVADQRRLDAAETMRVRNAKLRLGSALQLSGRIEEGLSLVREAVALEREQNPAESDDRLAFANALASALASAERTDEWMAEEDRLTGIVARLGTETHWVAVFRRVRRARLFALLGRSAEAQALVAEAQSMATSTEESLRVQAELVAALDERLQLRLSDALARLERTVREHSLETLPLKVQSDVAAELGTVRLELGDPAGAEKELVRCQELFQRAQVEPSIPVSACLLGAARLDLRQGRFAEAEQLMLPLATSWERVNPDSPGRGEVLHWLALAENGAGKVGATRRDAQLADSLLRRSKLPALRRLVERRLTAR